jgi:hypothetical protein
LAATLFAAEIFSFTNQVMVDSGQVGAGGVIAGGVHDKTGEHLFNWHQGHRQQYRSENR